MHDWNEADSKYSGAEPGETARRIIIGAIVVCGGLLIWANLLAPPFE